MQNNRKTRSQHVHELFRQNKFPANIDWKTAFYDAAVLATRLMNSPQGLQHDYCFYFGTNSSANLLPKTYAAILPENTPVQYTCDKAVGELDADDIRAVNAQRYALALRVRFTVEDMQDRVTADCQACEPDEDVNGLGSNIRISRSLYDSVMNKTRTPEDNARMTFLVATTLIHEAAHAAHYHRFGTRPEDFREVSIAAEAGYESLNQWLLSILLSSLYSGRRTTQQVDEVKSRFFRLVVVRVTPSMHL